MTERDRPLSDRLEAQVTSVKRRYVRALPRVCLVLLCAVASLTVAAARSRASAARDPRGSLTPTAALRRVSPIAATRKQTRLLISDMTEPSERMPEGVPPWYDWAGGPRARPLAPVRSFRAFISWGQLYQCAGTSRTPGEAVELRDLQAWVLFRRSHRWRRVQFSSDLEGAAFAEDFRGPTIRARYAASPRDTIDRPVPGHNFHFWPRTGRVPLRASKVAGIVVAVEARLRPTARRRRPSPCLVLSAGGDMWRSLEARPVAGASGDVGIGRFKLVRRHWRLFSMTSGPPGLLERVPMKPIAPRADEF